MMKIFFVSHVWCWKFFLNPASAGEKSLIRAKDMYFRFSRTGEAPLADIT